MRRIAPLTAVAVVSLVSMLVGCDDSARPSDARDTVPVGTLALELPTTATTAVTATAVPTNTASAPATGTAPPRADPPTTGADTSGPATSESTADGPATTDSTDASDATRLVDVLAGLVEGEIPSRVPSTTLRDDTGRLRIAVPQAWTDRRTAPAVLDDGSETPSLAASPDLTSFLDGYDTAGLTALVVDDDPADALAAYAFGEDCLNRRRGPYRTDELEGRYEVWESCGGTLDDIVTIAVRPAGSDESVLVLVQIVGPEDLVALDTALGSLDLRA